MSRVSELTRTRNQDATLWVGGGMDERVDEDLLWELFSQVGPVVDVSVPADRVTGRPAGFAFVEFRGEMDAEYAMRVLNMVPLYGKCMRVRRSGEGGNGPGAAPRAEVGANLFVGNLAEDATERALYDTFSAFGCILETRVQRDLESGAPKGFGFVNFDSFEAADAAIEALNGQFLSGRPVVVQYALRKDSRTERHGSAEERTLAASARSARAAGGGSSAGAGGIGSGGAFSLQPNRHFAQAQGMVDSSVAPGVQGGALGAGGSRMLGLPQHQLPPMLPHAAILPAGLAPLPLPLPPPLPAHMLQAAAGGGGARADNRPAWQVAAAAAAAAGGGSGAAGSSSAAAGT
jgi:splicing factor 3B subunit 4